MFKIFFHKLSSHYLWCSLFLAGMICVFSVSQTVAAELVVAERLIQSVHTVSSVGGEVTKVIVAFKNTGSTAWHAYRLLGAPSSLVVVNGVSTSPYVDSSWVSPAVVVEKASVVMPQQVIRETFYFRTPPQKGESVASFMLEVDGRILDTQGLAVSIPVTAIADAPLGYEPPVVASISMTVPPAPPVVYRFSAEPRLRVAIWRDPGDVVLFQSAEDDYRVWNGDVFAGILPKGQLAKIATASNQYVFVSDAMTFSSLKRVRLEPVNNPHAVFVIPNLVRRIRWKGPKNFNAYRGAMEYVFTKNKADRYIVEDVLMEDYVAGIAETSNIGPEEYIKALLVAARTYGYYIANNTTKHDQRNFDLVAHTGDQLYLGYESEKLMPRVVEAAKATRGFMVTYGGNIVITPYFANTSGQTKSWKQVWGGVAKPWLVPVKATYDKRDKKKLAGHGVGMSARDAAVRADEEKLSFEELLTYYYTGVAIEREYE